MVKYKLTSATVVSAALSLCSFPHKKINKLRISILLVLPPLSIATVDTSALAASRSQPQNSKCNKQKIINKKINVMLNDFHYNCYNRNGNVGGGALSDLVLWV